METSPVRDVVTVGKMVLVEIPEAAAGVVFWVALLRWLSSLISGHSWLQTSLVSILAVVSGYGAYRLAWREGRRIRTQIARQQLSPRPIRHGAQGLTETLLAAAPSTGLLRSSMAAVKNVAANFASDGFVRYYNLYIDAGPTAVGVRVQASIASLVRQQVADYYFPADYWGDSESYELEPGLAPFRERYIHRVRGWRKALLLATENASADLAKATEASWQVCHDGENALRMTLYMRAMKHRWTLLYLLMDGVVQHNGREIGLVAVSGRRRRSYSANDDQNREQ